MYQRLARMNAMNQNEASVFFMIERTKVQDLIFLKYNIRANEIIDATKLYDLDNDSDIKAMRAALNKERDNLKKQKKEMKQNALNEAQIIEL